MSSSFNVAYNKREGFTPGIRHIAFVVEDIEAHVARLKKQGVEVFSEIHYYEDSHKLCYVRGPEGIILELAEPVK